MQIAPINYSYKDFGNVLVVFTYCNVHGCKQDCADKDEENCIKVPEY